MEQKTNNASQGQGGKSNKTLWFSMLGALLLIILVVAAPRLKNNSPAAPSEGTTDVADTEEMVSEEEESSSTPKVLSKADAIIKYEGRRIEFNDACQANPNTLAVQAGTSIMLDNQSGTPRTVTVGANVYAIGAYKYRTTVLDTAGAIPVACGSNLNVAAIIVE